MRYWWVNQNQTFRQEFAGGYLWSPKRNRNQARNPFYETMREVAPGDLIFSFSDTFIIAIGIAQAYCFEAPKPIEFGTTGSNWENVGWKIRVKFEKLNHRIRPKEHIEVLRPLLPKRYAPLQQSGDGLQGVYLTELPTPLAEVLTGLIGGEAKALTVSTAPLLEPAFLISSEDEIEGWERKMEKEVIANGEIPETERLAIVSARRGQGLFKRKVMELESRCRVTKVDNPAFLIASHCKPWRDASNSERLQGENGLLLTPSIDRLFDRGFISFEDSGRLIVSPVAHRISLERMGVRTQEPLNVGGFSSGQSEFLNYHRNNVLLKSQLGKKAALIG